MPSHNSAAKSAREHKERNPSLYCPERRCLWRTGGGYCPRHKRVDSPLKPGDKVRGIASGLTGTVAGHPIPARTAGDALLVRVIWDHRFARKEGSMTFVKRLERIEV